MFKAVVEISVDLEEINQKQWVDIAKELNCNPKEFWHTIRIALTGEHHGPALDMIIKIYGLNKVESRIDDAYNL